ncbi:FAD-dependent monooxygenase [Microbacterium ureisolvens]|uniref:FAD-dependent monooxygenase n=1 Tax=Microbacterium ureisolvens TaxID=2781186 RepID=A0ABS7HZ56_9MICO|nr:FAD-dependent monooxygenase [Microbacterium ureisolvens]MBW9110681.1 FAD-dependent monooxygenase [Microbacterium ureisolvens]
MSSVLVSGASIAGLCAAAQLADRGFTVTVVERAPALRRTGSPIDVRGEALNIAREMGILDQIYARRVVNSGREHFTTFVDHNGDPVAALPNSEASDSDEDIEIARDSLIDILHGLIADRVTFVYDESVVGVTESPDAVTVVFASGKVKPFDIVIGADGIHSSVRRAVFGPELNFRRHLGVYFSIVELPLGTSAHGESFTYNVPGLLAGITDFGSRTLGFLAFRSPEIEYDYHDLNAQKQLILDAFEGEHGWRVQELTDAVRNAPDLYFDSVSQVRMTTWSHERVVLVGDAAHAAALFSGRGTSLAMMGARALGEALVAPGAAELSSAYAAYEAAHRGHVLRAQEGVPEARDIMVPDTASALAERNLRFPLRAA